MNLRRIVAMTVARSLEFLRDRSALGWNIFVPVLMVAGMAVIFSGPGQPLFKVAVLADAPLTAQLHPFLATQYVKFYAEDDHAGALAKVERHRIDMLIDLRTSARAAPGATVGSYWINTQSPKGVTLEHILTGTPGPKLARETLNGAQIRYVDWLAPGVLGMNMMFSCLFGLGYVIVRYRKSGYLKRLNATPLLAIEFILAQLVSRLALILAITIGVYIGCNLFLHFRMEGSYLDLFIVTLVGAVAMLAMGLVVSARVTSEELAGGLLNLLTWPMMIASGVFFSVDGAPRALQWLAQALPLTHLLTAARAIMLDGAGLAQIWPHLAVLLGMALVFLVAGAASFRWRQD